MTAQINVRTGEFIQQLAGLWQQKISHVEHFDQWLIQENSDWSGCHLPSQQVLHSFDNLTSEPIQLELVEAIEAILSLRLTIGEEEKRMINAKLKKLKSSVRPILC